MHATTRRFRILTTLAAVVTLVVAAALLAAARSGDDSSGAAADSTAGGASVVRPDSHRLSTAPEGRVTLVEFLDFECEACRAMFPVVEQLREEYRDRVTFVVRYFPIPSHFNAERAARAVEAAASQGRFEQMYQRMYETQSGWGEQRVALDDVFRNFAADLGLDLAAYDAAYNDPATAARVRADFEDGLALGVEGTPTFFVNNEKITARGYRDLATALDSALA
ncbi:thioredoxin [Nocardia cyriacigeorgica]|uniref:Thioredoxin n=1 Tax=Nocardia cyriacigeorgica TaxID=135487 RepID=A0A5R8PEB2_9NOCA|nr:thioredoxin domain-containing protein [Nocardia cyriacigeorgica]TLG08867.1 thioredoxin [Nocardia cyriacigeorgica]